MRYALTVLGILLLIGGLAAVKGAQIGQLVSFGKEMKAAGPPPEAVATAAATRMEWEDSLDAVGTVSSGKGVGVTTDVAGVVTRIHFDSGDVVKAGQVLVELDASVERAQLASATARQSLAATNYDRTRVLTEKGALAPSQLDNDDSARRASNADVASLEAQIAKKTIRAPFAGHLGIRAVNLGQYLNPGTAVTFLETIDALHVDFTLPQQDLPTIAVGMPVVVVVDDAEIPAELSAVAPEIDPATRTIKLRADLPKQDDRLRAGMFVNVRVIEPKKDVYVVAPATAIVHAPYGDSVFVIEDKKPDAPGMRTTPDGKTVKVARQQFVRLGPARGDFVAISKGVDAGQELVIAGGFKLRNNSPVVVDPTKQPAPKLAPHVENR